MSLPKELLLQIPSHHSTALTPTLAPTNDEPSYADMIAQLYPARCYQSRDEQNAEDISLQAFKNDLTSKGAAQFLNDLNLAKIEELIEKYRAELEKFAEENPDVKMDIDQMVNDYRKQLMEQFMTAQDEKKAQMLNPNRAVSKMILQMSEKSSPVKQAHLASLLQTKDDNKQGTVLI